MRTAPRSVGRALLVLATGLASLGLGMPPATAAINPTPDVTDMTNGAVFALLRAGDFIYVGGQFDKVRSTPPGAPGDSFDAQGLARFDAVTGRGDPTWTPDVTWGSFVTTSKPVVWALAAAGGKIWVGGDFGAVDDQPRTNFAAVDEATGAVDPGVTAAVGDLGLQSVRAMVASSSMVYVGGFFKTVDGVGRRRLAAFQLDGTLDDTWKPKADKRVFSMAWDCASSSIFVGGQFRRAAGAGGAWEPRETVARFDPTTGGLLPWAIPAGTIELNQKAYDLAPTCTQLNVAYGGRNYAAAFALDQGDTGTQRWRDMTTGNVQAITVLGNQIVIGGHFTSVMKTTRVRIAALDPSTGALDPSWSPAIEGQWGGPWALIASDSHLWVGGQFTTVAGMPQYFVARFTFS